MRVFDCIVVCTLVFGCGASTPESEPADTAAVADVAAAVDVASEPDTGQPDTSPADAAEDAPDVLLCPASCEDFDACTEDACVAGACVHEPIAGCCQAADPCDDGIACTVDKCNVVQHRCQHDRDSNLCCVTTSDCDDLDPCTSDVCLANQCAHLFTASESCACSATLMCDDSNACTTGTCSLGVCVFALSSAPGCCTSAADCDDADPKTSDGCQLGLCWHAAATPCAVDGDCTPTNACQSARCEEGRCVAEARPSCCIADFECRDGLVGTDDRCVKGACVHWPGPTKGCVSSGDCEELGPCTASECVPEAGLCTAAPLSGGDCCTADAECPAADVCTTWSCALGTCESAPTGATPVVWSESFDAGTLAGFVTTGSSTVAFWQVTTVDAVSAPGSLYYGRLPQNDYNVGASSGTATSPEIALPQVAIITLSFERHLAVEPGQANDKVWMTVEPAGEAPVTIWDKSYNQGPGAGWKHVDLDLAPFAGKTIRLVIHFDSVDEKSNGAPYEGAYFDDLVISTACP